MSDEVAQLRQRLEAGDWEALLEPTTDALLLTALLADAGWWPRAVVSCCEFIASDALTFRHLLFDAPQAQAYRHASAQFWDEVGARWVDPPPHDVAPVALRMAHNLTRRRWEHSPHRRALDVLRQWPT